MSSSPAGSCSEPPVPSAKRIGLRVSVVTASTSALGLQPTNWPTAERPRWGAAAVPVGEPQLAARHALVALVRDHVGQPAAVTREARRRRREAARDGEPAQRARGAVEHPQRAARDERELAVAAERPDRDKRPARRLGHRAGAAAAAPPTYASAAAPSASAAAMPRRRRRRRVRRRASSISASGSGATTSPTTGGSGSRSTPAPTAGARSSPRARRGDSRDDGPPRRWRACSSTAVRSGVPATVIPADRGETRAAPPLRSLPQRAQHRVGVDPELSGEVLRRRQPLAGLRLAVEDRPADLGRDLLEHGRRI